MYEILNSSISKKGTLKKLQDVSKLMPSADVLDFMKQLTEAYKESNITKREIEKIHATKEIVLTQIEKKYDLYHKVFDKIFDERKEAIDKSFTIIDKGLKEGDKELISMGLQNLSKVVSTSPFGDLNQLSNLLENNNTIEI